ncbi:DUF4142 domain-containing protein [Azospirillum sp. A39]|uniref:DUF4142 domain-containing protein n=1 Tax=Azospirillum sp. A39 TaxID=3462279 RepID=UPI004045C01C
MRRILAAACVATLFAGPALAQQGASKAADLALQDRNFIAEAAIINMAEVQGGTMAADTAENQRVQRFARTIADDHAKNMTTLKELAKDLGVALPEDVDAATRTRMEDMKGLSGGAFDRRFMGYQEESHASAVKLFQAQVDTAENQQVREYAEATLPALRHHFEMAREITASLAQGQANVVQGGGQPQQAEVPQPGTAVPMTPDEPSDTMGGAPTNPGTK